MVPFCDHNGNVLLGTIFVHRKKSKPEMGMRERVSVIEAVVGKRVFAESATFSECCRYAEKMKNEYGDNLKKLII
jgi:hypothetical protein